MLSISKLYKDALDNIKLLHHFFINFIIFEISSKLDIFHSKISEGIFQFSIRLLAVFDTKFASVINILKLI
jgi:hypothetical protein